MPRPLAAVGTPRHPWYPSRVTRTAIHRTAVPRPRAGPPPPEGRGSGRAEPEMGTMHIPVKHQLILTISEEGPSQLWRASIQNVGNTEVTVAADLRLLSFEVAVPGKKKTSSCRVPKAMRLSSVPEGSARSVAPGEQFGWHFDPRLLCFSSSDQDVLVPGASVLPRFGWERSTKTKWKGGKKVKLDLPQYAPFVAWKSSPQDGAKFLEGAPINLDDRYSRWSGDDAKDSPAADDEQPEIEKPTFRLTMLKGSDAATPRDATIRLRLSNQGPTKQSVFFRREFIRYDVLGPRGQFTCASGPDDRVPTRVSWTGLKQGGSTNLVTRLVEGCHPGSLDRPGLYLVRATFEPRDKKGYPAKPSSHVSSKNYVSIRIRTGAETFDGSPTFPIPVVPPALPPPGSPAASASTPATTSTSAPQ